MPEYLVVSRAQGGIRLGKDDPILLRRFPTPIGPADILIGTRLSMFPGSSKPLPMGLMSEVRGVAPSLDEALQEFSRTVQSLCPVLTLIGNSPIQDMTPEIGYDITAGALEREYFQQFMPEERLLYVERRRVSSELVVRVLEALFNHPETERIRRAIGQYYQALRNWEPGQETLALAHLWMGVEALTAVTLRRVLAAQMLDRAGLADAWDVEERQLEADVRRRLLLHGDVESYKRAKAASDGFEHGYLGFPEVHAHADAVRVKVASHLRESILDELGLHPVDRAALLAAPYDSPGHLRIAKYLRGKLVGEGDTLAAPGQAYPCLTWQTDFIEVANPLSDAVTLRMQERLTGNFADGIAFRLEGVEVWGGQESALRRDGV